MSTNEALRTQLDALQAKLYALEVENQRLREERPEQAEVADLEDKLKQVQEENVRLSQQVSELSVAQEDTPGAVQPGVEELREKLMRSEEEAAELKRQATQQAEELAKEKQRYNQLHAMLEERQEVQRDLEQQLGQAADAERGGAADAACRRGGDEEVGGT